MNHCAERMLFGGVLGGNSFGGGSVCSGEDKGDDERLEPESFATATSHEMTKLISLSLLPSNSSSLKKLA